ncbi:MAG: DNA primase [Endomicrobium sp.]|jgi:DNA primase|nr:DNA primase [Endomicrobium sp.]
MISENIIEKIRLSSNIESVIREYLPDLKRIGRNWKGFCPFHNEKTPSFIVSPEKGIFRCFGCNVAGDVFKFIMLIDNLSWIESVKKLAEKANIKVQELNQKFIVKTKMSEKMKLLDILESSAVFYHKCLLESIYAEKARKYFKERGVNYETINKFKLGFAPSGMFLGLALRRGYTCTDLVNSGLIKKTSNGTFWEYMSDRIVFPIFDVYGKVIAFGGRSITDKHLKYLNTPETIIYSKSSNLYGLFQTLQGLRSERKIIILEGYMDVIILQQFGVVGTVATLGTAFTQNHVKLISRYSDITTLLFDSDDAGRFATQKALEILIENGVECRVSSLPENVDADEYIVQYGKENFLKLVEDSSKNAIDFVISRMCGNFLEKSSSPEVKAKIVINLLNFVTKSSNSIIQREYIKNISHRINVNEEDVWREFKKKQQLEFKKFNTKNFTPYFVTNKIGLMSLEESLLNFILSNKSYIKKINFNCFKDLKCKKVFEFANSGLSNAEILNVLPDNDKNWFSELMLSSIEYSDIEETFNILLNDIKLCRLKNKRRYLEREILLMSDGKRERDEKIFDEYKKLTIFLKGSGK